ncbi:MAG: hypothetical protein KA184_15005, partial [Candidatus Hydrogenedentes bacterium]|nr:hypothetical protein [Candidatus Hydrogenedentota bacterium]
MHRARSENTQQRRQMPVGPLTGDQMYPASGCADVAEAVLVFNPATMYLRFHIEHPFTAPE